MSKGSTPRPFDVTQEEFANRFDAIFGKPKQQPAPDDDKQQEERTTDD